jgi:hypothetical protein
MTDTNEIRFSGTIERLKKVQTKKWTSTASWLLQVGKDKEVARRLAIQLHSEISDQLTRKKDIGRADAVCIAHFGEALKQLTHN